MEGRTHNLSVVGYGNSELEDYLKVVADKQDRVLEREATPEKGYFYRSDHFSFAKVGVPVLYAESGNDYVGKPEGFGDAAAKDYTSKRYHKVKDEFNPDWDYSGALQDMELLYEIGHTIANERSFPNWYEGNEFRSIRDESRK
jgi:Zn-dependent M28 family amino/carboxypeptidase